MSQEKHEYSSESKITGSYSQLPIFVEEDAPIKRTSPTNKKSRLTKIEDSIKTSSFNRQNQEVLTYILLILLLVLISGSYFYNWKITSSLEDKVKIMEKKMENLKNENKDFKDEVEIRLLNLEDLLY
jgi:hypothetical protein